MGTAWSIVGGRVNKDIQYKMSPFPCAACGATPEGVDAVRMEGRPKDNYRVVCKCGAHPRQWSVSENAAIRLWNSFCSDHSQGERNA